MPFLIREMKSIVSGFLSTKSFNYSIYIKEYEFSGDIDTCPGNANRLACIKKCLLDTLYFFNVFNVKMLYQIHFMFMKYQGLHLLY